MSPKQNQHNTVTAGDLILQGLNKQQQEAVRAVDGPVLILAGAGSGKTRTLIHRIAYLIAETGAKPWNILAVTFTNKAAESMRERMIDLLGADLEHMPTMGTFHSICSRLLRKEIEAIGYNSNFVIFDSADQLGLVKKVMKDKGYDTKQISPTAIHWKISWAKNQLVTPEAYSEMTDDALSEVAAEVYPLYQQELQTNNALDFDDLIMKTVHLFERYPEILKKYQTLWKHILVDEYQDTNPAQYKLVTLLAQDHGNICVVGDDAQCVTPETKIKTTTGWKQVKNIKRGEKIVAAAGRGTVMEATVRHIGKKRVNATIYKIKTSSGKVLRATPEHMMFVRVPENGTTRFSTERKVIRVDWFAHDRNSIQSPWYPSRIALHTTNTSVRTRLEQHGYNARRSKKNTWRMEISRRNIKDVEQAAAQLKKILPEIEQQRGAWVTNKKKMAFLPASHVKPGLLVPVLRGKKVIEEQVIAVEKEQYSGEVIDLNVDGVHNFCAEGIIVHNSIYSWRAADIRNILEFEKDYPSAITIVLEQNYRSTQTILEASNAVIAKNKKQKKKKLWTDNHAGEPIVIKEVPNEEAEGEYIVRELLGLNNKETRDGGVTYTLDEDAQPDPDDAGPIKEGESILDRIMGAKMFAANKQADDLRQQVGARKKEVDFSSAVVLYRTNAQSRALEESFLKYGIPYKLIGGMRFYERREIKDMLAYLRALYNPDDWVALERVVNAPPRGIGDRTWFKIEQFAKGQGVNVLEAAKQSIPDIQPQRLEAFYRFAEIFGTVSKKMEELNPTEILELLLKEIEYKEYLLTSADSKEQGEARWENVQELKTVTQKFQSLRGAEGLQALLEDVALVTDQDEVDEGENAVKLMTVHAAKGLEFPLVFVVGMEEGLFPHSRSLANPTEMEEERRLFYVALTRAIDRATLLFASQRIRYGDIQVNPPSRFIDEIPAELVEWR